MLYRSFGIHSKLCWVSFEIHSKEAIRQNIRKSAISTEFKKETFRFKISLSSEKDAVYRISHK